MKQAFTLALLVLSLMAMMLGLALLGLEHVALDERRYDRYQAELDVYDDVGVSMADLQAVQHNMARYLANGATDDQLNRVLTLRGAEQPIFNEREMSHMHDVRALFVLARHVKLWSQGIGLALLVAALTMIQHRRIIAFSGLMALGLWLAAALVVAASCGFDFSALFIRFHELLFRNDLWLLNPATDAMIRMYPEQFFAWMARDIALFMGLFALIPALAPLALLLPVRKGARS